MAERPKARNQFSDKREIRVDGDLAYVQLNNGHYTIIDAEDVMLVEGGSWHAIQAGRTFYAAKRIRSGLECRVTIRLHRLVINAMDGVFVDHINGNGLDNRKQNLRFANQSQNMANQRLSLANTSGKKGVSFDNSRGLWSAKIQVKGKTINLGRFSDVNKAHNAYAEAAELHFGEFSRLI